MIPTDTIEVFGTDAGEQVAVLLADSDVAHWGIQATVEKFPVDHRATATWDELKNIDPALFQLDKMPLRSQLLESGLYVGDLSGEVLSALGFDPYATVEVEGNLLVNQGIQRLEDLLIAVAVQAYDNTHARIGVGDDATAAAAGNTDLTAGAGSTHRQFVVMDSTFPSRSSQTLSFKATHTTGLSNFHWQEWGIDNGTANGTTVTANLLNHKVTDLGTKTSAAAWAFTVTLVIS